MTCFRTMTTKTVIGLGPYLDFFYETSRGKKNGNETFLKLLVGQNMQHVHQHVEESCENIAYDDLLSLYIGQQNIKNTMVALKTLYFGHIKDTLNTPTLENTFCIYHTKLLFQIVFTLSDRRGKKQEGQDGTGSLT